MTTAQQNRPTLTPRQTEILELVADGRTDPEIAERLSLSVGTVHNHVLKISERLGARGRAACVATAMRRGLIS